MNIEEHLKIDSKDMRSDFIPAIEGLAPGEKPETPAATPPPVVPAAATPPPAVETPVTPPASVKPESTEPPPPAQPDLSKVINEKLKAIFGDDIEDEDSAKAYIESLKKAPEPVNPFANNYVKGLNDYLKANPSGTKDIYDKIVSLDVSKLDHLQALKTKMLWDHPELSEADVDLFLKREFRQSDDIDDDEEKRMGAVNLTIHGAKAKKELQELQERHRLPDDQKAKAEEQDREANRIESLKPVVKKLVDELAEVEFDLGENPEKEARGTFKYVISDQDLKKEIRKELNDVVQYSNITNSKEDLEVLKNTAMERLKVKRMQEIIKAACEHTETIVSERLRKKYSNAAPPHIPESLPPARTGASAADSLFDKITGGRI